MSEKMKTISIKGKNYVQVNERVKAFRSNAEWNGWTIETAVKELTDDVCVMCARVVNPEGRTISTGWAREVRNDASSTVNKTSYVENCETSAVGRALGYLGIGIDENICSAEELQYAVQAQEAQSQKIAPAAPVSQKGNVIRPEVKEPAKTQENAQKTDEALQSIYDGLTEKEFVEYTESIRQMSAAGSRDSMNAVYKRYKDAAFSPLLISEGMRIIKEKGW